MQPICRQYDTDIPTSSTFDYEGVRIILTDYSGRGCKKITHHDACTALRGLAEFMVLRNGFNPWTFDIYINGFDAGEGKILETPRSLSASAPDVETA